MKTHQFLVYFNRPAMQRGDSLVWTVKFREEAFHVKDIELNVPCHTRFRPDGPQPRAGIAGAASNVRVVDGIAVIS